MVTNKEVSKAIDMMDKSGIDYLIAGGYARDMAHGVEPKDLDIMVTGDSFDFHKLCKQLPYTEKFATGDSGFEGSDDYADPFVVGVLKIGSNVDIVMWSDTMFGSPECVVRQGFDFNINQYVLDDISEPPRFVGNDQGDLARLLEELTPERVSKVTKIARKLGWQV